jgi:hypothetical protein
MKCLALERKVFLFLRCSASFGLGMTTSRVNRRASFGGGTAMAASQKVGGLKEAKVARVERLAVAVEDVAEREAKRGKRDEIDEGRDGRLL